MTPSEFEQLLKQPETAWDVVLNDKDLEYLDAAVRLVKTTLLKRRSPARGDKVALKDETFDIIADEASDEPVVLKAKQLLNKIKKAIADRVREEQLKVAQIYRAPSPTMIDFPIDATLKTAAEPLLSSPLPSSSPAAKTNTLTRDDFQKQEVAPTPPSLKSLLLTPAKAMTDSHAITATPAEHKKSPRFWGTPGGVPSQKPQLEQIKRNKKEQRKLTTLTTIATALDHYIDWAQRQHIHRCIFVRIFYALFGDTKFHWMHGSAGLERAKTLQQVLTNESMPIWEKLGHANIAFLNSSYSKHSLKRFIFAEFQAEDKRVKIFDEDDDKFVEKTQAFEDKYFKP